jgi:GDP-L-fucose synthase
VTLWGDGTPLREFMYSDDLAEAVIFLLENISPEKLDTLFSSYPRSMSHLNVGSGFEISILFASAYSLEI